MYFLLRFCNTTMTDHAVVILYLLHRRVLITNFNYYTYIKLKSDLYEITDYVNKKRKSHPRYKKSDYYAWYCMGQWSLL